MTPRWRGRWIYIKVLLEFLALIFFAVACGLCFTAYLTAGRIKNDFKGVFDWQRSVLLSAAIIYAILFILTFLACSYTVHLTSDYFDKDDHFFKQLWKLLGLDKEKLPLPSPFDEKSEKDESENAYLEPIVHVKGPKQLHEVNLHDREKPEGMFTFTYKPGQNRPEKMKYNETFIMKIAPDNLDLETFVLDENTYPTIFDVFVEPSGFDKNGQEQFKREDNFEEEISTDVAMKKIALKDSENLDFVTFVPDENTSPIRDFFGEPSGFDKNDEEQFKREDNFGEKISTDVGMKKIALKDSENLDFGTKLTKKGTEKLVYKESMVSKIPSNVELDRLIIGNIAGIEKMLDL